MRAAVIFWASWLVASLTVTHGVIWRAVSLGWIGLSDGLDAVNGWLVAVNRWVIDRACAASGRAVRLAASARRRLERLRP